MDDLKKKRVHLETQAWDLDQRVRRDKQLLFEA